MAGPEMFDSQTLRIPCTTCGQETEKTVGWIKTHDHFTCACGQPIRLDRNQFLGEIRKAEKAVADFRRTIGKLGKR